MNPLIDKIINHLIKSHKHVMEDPSTKDSVFGISSFPVKDNSTKEEFYLMVTYTIKKALYPDPKGVSILNVEKSDQLVTDEMLDFYNNNKDLNARIIDFTTSDNGDS